MTKIKWRENALQTFNWNIFLFLIFATKHHGQKFIDSENLKNSETKKKNSTRPDNRNCELAGGKKTDLILLFQLVHPLPGNIFHPSDQITKLKLKSSNGK